MQGNQQQAYDRGITIFSPDGRLYQVEYAREAVKRGTASIGIRTAEGVVLVVDKRIHSPLLEGDSVEKLHMADDHVGIASAGHVADARQLIDYARRLAQVEQLRYGQPVGVETLTKSVVDNIQQYTQVGGARPFGVALIIGGVDPDGTPRLFETDPSGTPYEWKALAIGGDRNDIESRLKEEYREDLTLEEGIALGLKALAGVTEGGLEPDGIGVATIEVGGQYRDLDNDELETYLTDLELLAQDDGNEDEE